MNYKIISDKDKLLEFIEWLPELKDNEKLYCSLFARKKYCPDGVKSSDKTQLKRFTSDKVKLFEKIKQLEIQIGDYKLRGEPIPQEALVLYINPNPRCMRKAALKLMRKCLDLIEGDARGYNIHAEALSAIQQSKSRGCFVDFDIDTKEVDLSILEGILYKGCYKILETRGGYHVLVNPAITPKTNWYQQITSKFPVDQTGDNMIPVPGTIQGNFVPTFINL